MSEKSVGVVKGKKTFIVSWGENSLSQSSFRVLKLKNRFKKI